MTSVGGDWFFRKNYAGFVFESKFKDCKAIVAKYIFVFRISHHPKIRIYLYSLEKNQEFVNSKM